MLHSSQYIEMKRVNIIPTNFAQVKLAVINLFQQLLSTAKLQIIGMYSIQITK